MASHYVYPLGLAPIHEQSLCSRAAKDYETLLPSPVTGKEIIRRSLNLKPCQWEEPLRALDRLESKQFVNIDAVVQRPGLIDIHVSRQRTPFISFGSLVPGIRHEKVQFHMSTIHDVENGVTDVSFLSDMIRIESLRNHMSQISSATPLIQLDSELEIQKQLFDFVGDLARKSILTVKPDGQVLFSGTDIEMKDLVSLVAEFYLASSSTNWKTQSVLIPYFDRLNTTEAWVNIQQSPLPEASEVAPLERPDKAKRKQLNKRKNSQRANRERDLYRRNYFHACESLLSLMLNKSQSRKSTIQTLKKSGPEIPELLTQFSAGIAGTGLAVLFSVMCKVASCRVPFCASNLFSTGLGFGLMWLAWAVNRLRNTVLYISKNAGQLSLSDAEMMTRVDNNMKEIFFRAATLMAVAFLRFA